MFCKCSGLVLVLVLLMSLGARTLALTLKSTGGLRQAAGVQVQRFLRPSSYSFSSTSKQMAGHSGEPEGMNTRSKTSTALSSNSMDSEVAEDTSAKGKIKSLWKRYGVVAIGTYLGIYVSVLSSMFFALDYDIFRSSTFGLEPAAAVQKVCDLVESWTGNTFLPGYFRENPRMGTFAVAWVMTKFTEPLRLGLAIAVVPSVARFLGRAPPKEAKKED